MKTQGPAFLSSSPSASSSPASHHVLAELLLLLSQAEVRPGSWRLHSPSLGYRCSAGVEVRDWEPGVKRDLGDETVSPGGTAGTLPASAPPRGTVALFLIQQGTCSLSSTSILVDVKENSSRILPVLRAWPPWGVPKSWRHLIICFLSTCLF